MRGRRAASGRGGDPGLCGAGEEIFRRGCSILFAKRTARRSIPGGRAGGLTARLGVERQHHVAPDRRRAAGARNGAHRVALEIADPHRDGVAVGEADAPIVAHRLRRAGLHRRPEGQAQRRIEPEGRRPGVGIGHHVGDDPGRLRRGDGARRRVRVSRGEPKRRPAAAIGERCDRRRPARAGSPRPIRARG